MARLIDADSLIEWLTKPTGFRTNCEDCCEKHCIECVIDEAIKNEPTVDAVEVVRCKDCKFNVANMAADSLDSTDYSDITCSYFMTDGMDAGDFCSRGEQIDGGDKE